MPVARFTKDVVEKLLKVKADRLTFDEQYPGFGLRTYKSGAAPVWFVKYSAKGVQRRMVLGYASWGNLEAARDQAGTVRAEAKLGKDVVAEERKARAEPRPKTLGELVEPYLEDRGKGDKKLRARSLYIYDLYLRDHWKPLHRKSIRDITRHDILPMLSEMARQRGDVTSDRAKSCLSRLMHWAIMEGYRDTNPLADIDNRASTEGRDRVLRADELVAVWNAAGECGLFGKAVRLLMLTGCRKTEICGLMWPELNLEQRLLELPAERVKIKRPVIVCLSEPAVEILESVPAVVGQPLLFGKFSASRHMDDLRALVPAVEGWTLHDIRRSYSTHANERGLAPPHVIECALGHLVGNKVSRTYNRALYEAERRQLADVWAQHLADLVAGRRPKVVPLRKPAA
jgi:integrase